MSRVPKLSPESCGLFTRLVFWMAERKMGKRLGKAVAPGPLGVYAHHPGVLRAVGSFEMAAEGWRLLPARLRTLAQIRAATLVGCPF